MDKGNSAAQDFLEWIEKHHEVLYKMLWKDFVDDINKRSRVVTKTLSNEELLDIVKKGFPNPRK